MFSQWAECWEHTASQPSTDWSSPDCCFLTTISGKWKRLGSDQHFVEQRFALWWCSCYKWAAIWFLKEYWLFWCYFCTTLYGRTLCHKCVCHSVFASSLDISKAFDCVNHFKLFSVLCTAGIPIDVINLLCNWYSKLFAMIRWNGA